MTVALDHIQLAVPAGGEAAARAFYGDLLVLREVDKPTGLAGRGGFWFVLSDGIGFHLGVDAAFRPATKAHPALRIAAFEIVLTRLEKAGHVIERGTDPFGRTRAYSVDPFGNRLELLQAA